MRTTNRVLMIEPSAFHYNPVAAETNTFAHEPPKMLPDVRERAVAEHHALAEALRAAGVDVRVFRGTEGSDRPDAVFPNWLSTHDDGRLVIYPMSPGRRGEYSQSIVDELKSEFGYRDVVDLRGLESERKFLESTSSMVLDRSKRVAYANVSSRTHTEALEKWSEEMGYGVVSFQARRRDGGEVYHTNVLMALGERLALAAPHMIPRDKERRAFMRSIDEAFENVVCLDENQVDRYAGNALQMRGEGGPVWVLSSGAWDAFRPDQRALLECDGEIVHVPLAVLESVGGGSARCTLCEVFVPRGSGLGE